MSLLDRALTAVKDVILLREQVKNLRGDVVDLGRDVAGLVGDIRELEQRIARVEGSNETLRVLAARPARLPRK